VRDVELYYVREEREEKFYALWREAQTTRNIETFQCLAKMLGDEIKGGISEVWAVGQVEGLQVFARKEDRRKMFVGHTHALAHV